MSATRLAFRIAARESSRRRIRSLLVVLLVALPVAGMTMATTLIRTEAAGPLEKYRNNYGTADLGFSGSVGPQFAEQYESSADAVRAALPAGSETQLYSSWYRGLRTDEETAYADLETGDFSHPILDGRYAVQRGRLARAGGEVSVSPSFASRFGVEPGDVLELSVPDVDLEVVGVVEDEQDLRSVALYFSSSPSAELTGDDFETIRALVDVPGDLDIETARRLFDLAEAGNFPFPAVAPTDAVIDEIRARGYLNPDTPDTAIRWSIVAGALVLAVVGIVIAAAFTVGARQQLATLGQLSSNGAPESLRRRILVFQGTVSGIVGSAVGIVVASLGLRLGRSPLESILNHRIDSFTTRPIDLVVIAAVGIAGASIAALIPARSAARIPALQALAGRRPEAAVSRSSTAGGTIAFVIGLALLGVAATGGRSGTDGNLWGAVAVVGGLGVLFGATAITPALVSVMAPLSKRTNGTARLAIRNLTRHRTRTGAVVAAVAAAGALAVGGTAAARSAVVDNQAFSEIAPGIVAVSSFDENEGGAFPAPPPELVAGVERALGEDSTRHEVPRLVSEVAIQGLGDGGYGYVDPVAFVVDDDLAAELRLGDRFRAALEEHGVAVVKFSEEAPDQTVDITFGVDDPVRTELLFSRYSLGLGSGTYVTPDLVDALDLETTIGPVVFSTPDDLDEVQQFDLEILWQNQMETTFDEETGEALGPTWNIEYQSPSSGVSPRVVEAALAAVATLLALVVLGIGLALAAADDRDEATTMAVVGADPRTRRRTVATKAGIMAGLGFLLAIPIGYLPVVVVQSGSVPFPASLVVVLLLVVPAIAAAVTATASRIGSRLRPVHISTAMFE